MKAAPAEVGVSQSLPAGDVWSKPPGCWTFSFAACFGIPWLAVNVELDTPSQLKVSVWLLLATFMVCFKLFLVVPFCSGSNQGPRFKTLVISHSHLST